MLGREPLDPRQIVHAPQLRCRDDQLDAEEASLVDVGVPQFVDERDGVVVGRAAGPHVRLRH
jgi:hypothetical protein